MKRKTPDSHCPGSRPLSLALCITSLEVGGAERCLVEIATRLDRREFSPRVISLAPPPGDAPLPKRNDPGRASHNRVARDRGPLHARLEAAGVPMFFLNARALRDAPAALSRLTRWFAEHRPRVIHTFLHHSNVLGAVAAHRAGVGPTLAGLRVAEHRRPLRWTALAAVDPWIARHLCVSQSVADFSANVIGLSPAKLCVVPNGVDFERFRLAAAAARDPANSASRRLLAGPATRRQILCVGRLAPQKGIDRLVRLAPAFLSALPEHELVVVGRGDQGPSLEALARRGGFGSRIRFVPWQADIAPLMASAEVIVSLSRYEGMSNVLLEAMACGKPVVATGVEGVAELLGPGSSVQVVAPQCWVEAAGRIVLLCRNPLLAREIGVSNQARVAIHFSLRAMVERYAEAYRTHVEHGDRRR